MTEITPNPLVATLALKLVGEDGEPSKIEQRRTALQQGRESKVAKELADKLATDPGVPELVTLAGFLGGTIGAEPSLPWRADEARPWRVFYLDAKLRTWLLVNQADIVDWRRVKDAGSPFGERDVIWLKASASVTDGSGPVRPGQLDAEFLRGGFVGAGDFAASLTGGTFSRATGLLCEVQTPGCCGRHTR